MGENPQILADQAMHGGGRDGLRSQVERVLDLADHLPREDQALLRAVYDRGVKISELAAACGRSPSRLRRRARRLISRLNSPLFRFVLAAERRFSEHQGRVARLIIIEGCPIREAARRLNCSMHQVRQALTAIRALHEAEENRSANHFVTSRPLRRRH